MRQSVRESGVATAESVMELPVLLTGRHVTALEKAATERGVTAGRLIRDLLRQFLENRQMNGMGCSTGNELDDGRKPARARTAAELMSRPPETIHHRTGLSEAASLMARRRLHELPVVDDGGRFVGVITPADVFRGALDGRKNRDAVVVWTDWQLLVPGPERPDEVRWHLTECPVVVEADTSLAYAARRMADGRARYAVVVDEQRRPVGVITSGDLLASGGIPISDGASASANVLGDPAALAMRCVNEHQGE